MDLSRNWIPENVKTIHLIAVCGTGMGALACMLKDLGYQVTGSDQKVYPPMSSFLAQKGVAVCNGYQPENVAYGPDLVVVGNAVPRENPEAVKMFEMGLNFCSMPQALNHFVAADKKILLVSGTHGKTTTSSILAWLLLSAGYDPSFMIGGILKNFDSNYRLGKGGYVVIEGDEYDTAFFDKGPKFMHYDPEIAILTSVEFDHADIFTDLSHVISIFDTFISGLSEDSLLMAFNEDDIINRLLVRPRCRIERYGSRCASHETQAGADWYLDPIAMDPPFTSFNVFKHGELFNTFKTNLPGAHNLCNATAAIAVAGRLKIPPDAIAHGLETFEGVKRRQEIRGEKRGITVMDDFAHHPTAVRETIKAVKALYADRRLVAVFEPRTNSSMRSVFQQDYPLAFDAADVVCIRKPPLLEKIPVDDRFSSEQLVDDLEHRGKDAHYFPDTEAIIDYLCDTARPGDMILVMSNGGFDNIHARLLDAL
ncbi:MAG: UDP-N-acetylmuramate:L-alanyl-gamma-D-glutamyl-meso-diaminopimelate ligase [Deltaproteobacteria bacterium]|jgi:UDP-N-acetylmuramate: L-alanyl-gamma-D-glutamyl-meso-diaminopimelate ligase|nr:UDP-N-acetylmuramate:L-alanyl-gamma-D-glutamyl-meso-diaminopimelate ligase [Deltaproteobacteria bacterium]